MRPDIFSKYWSLTCHITSLKQLAIQNSTFSECPRFVRRNIGGISMRGVKWDSQLTFVGFRISSRPITENKQFERSHEHSVYNANLPFAFEIQFLQSLLRMWLTILAVSLDFAWYDPEHFVFPENHRLSGAGAENAIYFLRKKLIENRIYRMWRQKLISSTYFRMVRQKYLTFRRNFAFIHPYRTYE